MGDHFTDKTFVENTWRVIFIVSKYITYYEPFIDLTL